MDASVGLDRQPTLTGDLVALRPMKETDRDALFAVAESAIEDLTGHGVDALSVELVLDLLYTARELDTP